MAAFGDVEFEPAGRQRAQRVRVAEDQDVSWYGGYAGVDAVEAGGDLGGSLAVGYRVRPDRPARHGLADLRGGDAFVVPVVPLDQILIHHRVREAGEFRRTTGSFAR